MYNSRTRKGSPLPTAGAAYKIGEGVLEMRVAYSGLKKYLDGAVWKTSLNVANAPQNGSWISSWSSGQNPVDFGR